MKLILQLLSVFLWFGAALAQTPPIPNLSKWEANMLKYAPQFCDQNAINKALSSRNVDEGNIWYYDGTRVYQQIAAYTNNPDFYRCAEYVASAYETFAIGNRIGGWRVFPKGLYDNYIRTGNVRAAQAVNSLATVSAFAVPNPDPTYYGDSWEDSREIAYVTDAYIYNLMLGNDSPYFSLRFGQIFGHFDQWFGSQSAPIVKPFMVSLSAEALIEYYERVSQDPRILPAIQQATDWLWTNAWVSSSQSFQYGVCRSTASGTEKKECHQGPSPDLNLLIAPMFAWMYHQTGDVKYQIEGDQVFSGGVDLAWLGNGKQFSQNYRWSFKYVEWRNATPIPLIPTP